MTTAGVPPVEIVPWSAAWESEFEAERRRLLTVFDAQDVQIEHIGSTSVRGLGAKPIVDILVGAPSLAYIETRIPALEALGYHYVPELETTLPERRFFALPREHPRRFHLHATERGGTFWREHLRFRDALRSDPALARDYERLKRELAARHRNDRDAYTDAKTAFVTGVVRRALGRG